MEGQQQSRSDRTNGTDRTHNAPPLIPAHGGYRQLKSYQAAEIIYDATVAFCARFIDRRSRTTDQMIQAARSGKQNIAEASQASATSKKTELKLTGVARASLEELLLDYEDFLRQRKLPLWPKDHPQAQAIRRIAYRSNRSYQSYRSYVEEAPPEIAANAVICLIHQANYLLDQQLRSLEQRFLAEGGFTERLHSVRHQHRQFPLNSLPRRSGGPIRPPAPIGPIGPMTPKTASTPDGGLRTEGGPDTGWDDCARVDMFSPPHELKRQRPQSITARRPLTANHPRLLPVFFVLTLDLLPRPAIIVFTTVELTPLEADEKA